MRSRYQRILKFNKILRFLEKNDGYGVRAIARNTKLTPSTVSRSIKKLESGGYVKTTVAGTEKTVYLKKSTDYKIFFRIERLGEEIYKALIEISRLMPQEKLEESFNILTSLLQKKKWWV